MQHEHMIKSVEEERVTPIDTCRNRRNMRSVLNIATSIYRNPYEVRTCIASKPQNAFVNCVCSKNSTGGLFCPCPNPVKLDALPPRFFIMYS